jgi:hypothetical protein
MKAAMEVATSNATAAQKVESQEVESSVSIFVSAYILVLPWMQVKCRWMQVQFRSNVKIYFLILDRFAI